MASRSSGTRSSLDKEFVGKEFTDKEFCGQGVVDKEFVGKEYVYKKFVVKEAVYIVSQVLVSGVFQEARSSESQEFRSRGQGVLWAWSCDKESATRSSSTRGGQESQEARTFGG